MADNRLKRVAIVGASGNVGTSTVKALLDNNPDLAITIVSRENSTATFPLSPQVTVKKGDYNDSSFLESSFKDVDLVLFALNFMGGGSQAQFGLIDAAAKAGVKWIIPNEYAGNGLHPTLFNSVPLFADKVAARKHIEELAKTYNGLKWIGVATNPWLELSLTLGMFGFNVPDRKATLYSRSGNFNSSSMAQVGRGIARLLALPITDASNPRSSLEHYANNYVYISSFSISQDKLFASVQRVTGTSEKDWTVERPLIEGWIKNSNEKFAAGDMMAGAGLTYARYMGEGLGGDYESQAKEDRAVLGLEEEDLDEVVKGALADAGKYAY